MTVTAADRGAAAEHGGDENGEQLSGAGVALWGHGEHEPIIGAPPDRYPDTNASRAPNEGAGAFAGCSFDPAARTA